jgi:hypothetical protein
MDETPIKAGQGGPGQAEAGYFWPVYGERDEICFPFFKSREIKHVEAALGSRLPRERCCCRMATSPMPTTRRRPGSSMPSAGRIPVATSSRRRRAEPEAAAEALALIGELYQRRGRHPAGPAERRAQERSSPGPQPSRSSSASSPGSTNASPRRVCCRAIR